SRIRTSWVSIISLAFSWLMCWQASDEAAPQAVMAMAEARMADKIRFFMEYLLSQWLRLPQRADRRSPSPALFWALLYQFLAATSCDSDTNRACLAWRTVLL